MVRLDWLQWLVAVGLAILPSLACALDRGQPLHDLRHARWTPAEGAPADIWSLAQAGDGFLWLGTGVGLYRFDGHAFERVPLDGAEFRSNNITALASFEPGQLWLGSYVGDTALVTGRDDVRYFTSRQGMPGRGMVRSFARTPDGAVWVATDDGPARFDGTRWLAPPPAMGYPTGEAEWLIVDRRGVLWIATGSSLVFLRPDGEVFEPTGIELGADAVMAEDPAGRLWLSDADRGTYVVDSSEQPIAAPSHPPPDRVALAVKRMTFDAQGSLWLTLASGAGGIGRIREPATMAAGRWLGESDLDDTFREADGLPANVAVPLLEDREGSLWVGTNYGLSQFRDSQVFPIAELADAPQGGFAIVPLASGLVWLANRDRMFRFDPVRGAREVTGWPSVTSGIRGDDGTAWFHGQSGLWREADERPVQVPLPEGSKASDVRVFTSDHAGGLYLGLLKGELYHFRTGRWRRLDFEVAEGRAVGALALDSNGRLWVGADDTLYEMDATRDHRLVRTYKPGVGGISALHVRGRCKPLVAGEGGLEVIHRGTSRSIPASRYPETGGVTGIGEEPEGLLWLNGRRGVVRVTCDDLLAARAGGIAEFERRLFTASDGLPGIALQSVKVPSLAIDASGRVWVATNRGVAWLNPRRAGRNPVPPSVEITSLVAQGRTFVPASALQLPPRSQTVRLHYTAASMAPADAVRFRYRLLGVDTDWQDGGDRRESLYSNLRPGDYRFEVTAANGDGVWNPTGASLEFSVAPSFVQSRRFHAGLVICAAGALWLAYRTRLRQISRDVRKRAEERGRERERIARDLHDTLLQSIQGLILRFHVASERVQDPSLRDSLLQALDQAEAALVEGRDRVRDLRASAPAQQGLCGAVRHLGEELADRHGIDFQVVVEGTPRRMDRPVLDEVFSIVREAMTNASVHASARKIEVEIIFERRVLRIRVRDDGRGIDRDVLDAGGKPGHWGLTGMRERAIELGGELEVWSGAMIGTEVQLQVPLPAARDGAKPAPEGNHAA